MDIPQIDSDQVELAWMDTSTGEFFTQSSNLARRTFQEDVARISPTEIVVPQYLSRPENQSHPILTALRELDDPPIISHPHPTQQDSTSAGVFGSMARFSAVPLLSLYISETLLSHRPDLSHPLRVDGNNSMRVDRISLRALEIKQNNDGGTSGTLLSVMDKTVTAAGSRLLSDRIRSPSMSLPEINARLSVVSWMKEHRLVRDELVEHLKLLDDETRLLQKLSIGQPTAEDLLTMSRAIKVQGQIKALLESTNEKADAEASATGKHDADIEVLKLLAKDMNNFDALAESIEQSVDVKAVRAQKTRDAAAEAEADPVEESEAADTLEETGIDIWNIPDDVFRRSSKDKKVPKAAKAVPLDAAETNVPLDKNGQSPIDWGKFGDSVLTQRYVVDKTSQIRKGRC